MRILFFLLFPIFLSAQINRAYGVIEIGSTFPSSSSTGPKFAYRPADSAFYRWQHTNVWIKIVEPSITPDTLYLQQISGTTAIVNGDTINLTPYLLKVDTTSFLAPYIRLAGWGLLKTTKTLTVDSSKVASRYYAGTNPTTIANNYIATSNGTNLVARNLFDDNTAVEIKNGKPLKLGQWTTAGRPTGTAGYMGWRDGTTLEWYNGTRWAAGLESTFARGTQYRIPHFDANGQIVDDANLKFQSLYLYAPHLSTRKILTFDSQVAINFGRAETNTVVFYTPVGTDNLLYFQVGGIYKGQFTAGNSQFAINHINTVYIAQQGGTNPYIRVGGTGTSIGIGSTTAPSYYLHVQGTDAIGLPRGTVGNQPSIAANTTPLRFFTDTAAIGYGDGGVYNFVATRAYARTMKDGNGIISALPSGNVSISEQTRNLRLGLAGFYVDSIYINSQSIPDNTIIVNKAFSASTGITALLGSTNTVFNGTIGGTHGGFGNYVSHGATLIANSSASNFNNIQGISVTAQGAQNQIIGYNIDGTGSSGNNTALGRNIKILTYNNFIGIGDSLTATANGQVKIGNAANNSQLFFGQKFIYDYDTYLLQLSAYGTPATTAAALSKTESGYLTSFATDGTVLSRLADNLPNFYNNNDTIGTSRIATVLDSVRFKNGSTEILKLKSNGLVTLGTYTSSAPFTAPALGIDAGELFGAPAPDGKLIQRKIRETANVKDADLEITDFMLELAQDVHVWAYCSNAASDSVVIDLPTPGTDYLGQMVSIYGDGRNATPNRDVYVRCVGAKLWHGNASPTGETYYQVTSLALARNSRTAEFTCVQNPDDNLYYWQLKQHP